MVVVERQTTILPSNPEMTLDYYRREGLLKATRVGKRIRYTKSELMVLLENLTNRTNENLS